MASVSPQVTQIFQLAEACKVSMYAACNRVPISKSLPYRWRNGSHSPRLNTLESLRQAILEIAREQGTLPEGEEEHSGGQPAE